MKIIFDIKTKAERQAYDFLYHKLSTINDGYLYNNGWQGSWLRKNVFRTLGACKYNKKLICLNRDYVNTAPWKNIRNTIIHEIAHALHPVDGHGKHWKQTFLNLGGNGNRTTFFNNEKPKYPKYVLRRKDNKHILKEYYRKPQKVLANIHNMYIRGHKSETLGNLELVEVKHITT